MKQTPLKRKTPLKAKTVSSRGKPMKRSQPRRDWQAARAKVQAEGNVCRICGQGPAEAAHVIGREHDRRKKCGACSGEGKWWKYDADGEIEGLDFCKQCDGTGKSETLLVEARHVIPLCGGPNGCHGKYDRHELDVLAALTREEQVEATRLVGLENARRRVCPSEYGNG